MSVRLSFDIGEIEKKLEEMKLLCANSLGFGDIGKEEEPFKL